MEHGTVKISPRLTEYGRFSEIWNCCWTSNSHGFFVIARPFNGSIENPVKIHVVNESGTFLRMLSKSPVLEIKAINWICVVQLSWILQQNLIEWHKLPCTLDCIPYPSLWEFFPNNWFDWFRCGTHVIHYDTFRTYLTLLTLCHACNWSSATKQSHTTEAASETFPFQMFSICKCNQPSTLLLDKTQFKISLCYKQHKNW